ncbi:hypothetical protein EJF36_08210 [Bacillus sp. HMF5848]|uniref:ribonuclease H-like YkuK family protein n=1 Tax=Bacillus sp. HMF5848 TaxID=2495421 RepID=UPI000F7803DC|nr:ribonuclease H-like YkuK family protein [Bacillus sp. HMF5848]RSK26848.1 hypothetical protein EJF36_08210 [Bacillus sp. HMF5848]
MNEQDIAFYNVSEGHMSLETVVARMKQFIKMDPRCHYVISVGTDSQVHATETRFISALHIHRVGKGAWGCLKNFTVTRPITSLREKITLETALSQELACLLSDDYLEDITDILLQYAHEGADLSFEVHLDIGNKGATKDLIHDMTGRIAAMGFATKIKPDSYAATSYANRYTK